MTTPAPMALAPGAPREIRLDDLMGRVVHDADGARVGRIEELRAEWRGDECVVLEFHIGASALFERLGGGRFWSACVRLCGGGSTPHVVPWQHMDLRDVTHPRLTCRRSELPAAALA